MLYILFTTGQCNLKCKYCGGSFPPNLVPWKTTYPTSQLKSFIFDDPEPTIAFYGGEPLLNVKFIRDVMEDFPEAKFVIQSNGILARSLEPEYWLRFDAVLLSLDGRRKVTNYYRGAKVYDRIIDSARWLKTIGFKKDLIARMTVSEFSDIFLDVKHLLSLNLFDHVHWQLDVVWSSNWKDFDGWCESSYMSGISRLANFWIEGARKGRVLGLVPFVAVLKTMLKQSRIDSPPCGSGLNSLSILPNGCIVACPIAVDVNWAKLGNILTDQRDRLINRVKIGEPCTSCHYLKYCGGRCLYAHYERLWGEAGFNKTCEVTIHTIDELSKIKDEVLSLLDRKVISMTQLDYPTFNNTTEIIP